MIMLLMWTYPKLDKRIRATYVARSTGIRLAVFMIATFAQSDGQATASVTQV